MALGLTYLTIAALSAAHVAYPDPIERGHAIPIAAKGAEMESDDAFKRKLRQIKTEELQTLLLGRRLVPPPEKRAVPFAETFKSDKTWLYSQQRRALFMKRGKWHIEDDKVCVSINGEPLVCRYLFQDRKTLQFFIHEISDIENRLFEVSIIK